MFLTQKPEILKLEFLDNIFNMQQYKRVDTL